MLELTNAYIKCSTILRMSFKMFLRIFFSLVKPLTKAWSGEGCRDEPVAVRWEERKAAIFSKCFQLLMYFWVLFPIDLYLLIPYFQSRAIPPQSSGSWCCRSEVLQHWSKLLLLEWWASGHGMACPGWVYRTGIGQNAPSASFIQLWHCWVCGRAQKHSEACWAPEPM